MQIVFLTSNFPPMSGGISHYLYEIARHLSPEQIKVIGLPTPGWKVFDSQQDFLIQRLGLPSGWNSFSPQFKFLSLAYFWAVAQEKQASLILCGQAHHSLMLPAWLNWRLRGTPYGVFVHGLDLLSPQTRRHRRLFNTLLCAAQVVFANSRTTAEVALRLGVRPNRTHVINPTVDPAQLTSKVSPEAVRKKHGLEDKKCVLTVGRLVERKGHDTVIRALSAILKTIPETHYLIVGNGPYEASLRTLVATLQLDTHVTFAGYIPDDQLAAYYLACDVFAMISREIPDKGDIEGFGIVYLEANLQGKAVVAGRSGGVSDAVLHEKTGLLVNPQEPLEVADAIVRLLSDSKLAGHLGETGRTRVMNEFTSAVQVQKLHAIITRFKY